MMHAKIDDFAPPECIEHSKIKIPVYASLKGTCPLIVLHELPGMSESFIGFCRRMAEADYKVYMPLIFGVPGMNLRPVAVLKLCVRSEFRRLFSAHPGRCTGRPFTAWLLHLVNSIGCRHPDTPIGVVGMCLTGGFALAALARPNVDAVIACQPSWPLFFNIATLGLSSTERENAVERAKTLPWPCAKGYRYVNDWICRNQHMRAAEGMFLGAFERHQDLPGCYHSTLTGPGASEIVFGDVLKFLDDRLHNRSH